MASATPHRSHGSHRRHPLGGVTAMRRRPRARATRLDGSGSGTLRCTRSYPAEEGLPTDPLPPDDETTDAGPRARASRGDPLIGKVLDQRYRIVSLIAKGGMGRVYRAEQAPLRRVDRKSTRLNSSHSSVSRMPSSA